MRIWRKNEKKIKRKARCLNMNYPFECPKCNEKETISMPITQYTSEGHMCKSCGTEMVREVKSLVCGLSIDKTSSFFRKCN